MKHKPEGMSPQEWEEMLQEEWYYKRIEAKQEEEEERRASRCPCHDSYEEDFDFERDCGAAP